MDGVGVVALAPAGDLPAIADEVRNTLEGRLLAAYILTASPSRQQRAVPPHAQQPKLPRDGRGKDHRAARGLVEGVRLAREIGDRRGLSSHLCTLGFASYLDNADADARAMFHESLAIAQRNGDPLMVAYADLGLALIASRNGDAQAAATLHGAADAIHDRLGTRFDSLESRLRDADLTRLRAALGGAELQSAYDAGRASDVLAVVTPA